MTIANDVLQVVLRSTYLGQAITNVFHYRVTSVGSVVNSAQALNAGWTASVLPSLRAITNTGINYIDLYTVNLGNPTEMDTYILNVSGSLVAIASDQATSYMAFAFKYERTSAMFRNGWKRFAGVSDTQLQGNGMAVSLVPFNALATALGLNLNGVGGPGWTFQPFVARRPIVYGTNPAGYPTNVVSFQRPTTQNTRKP